MWHNMYVIFSCNKSMFNWLFYCFVQEFFLEVQSVMWRLWNFNFRLRVQLPYIQGKCTKYLIFGLWQKSIKTWRTNARYRKENHKKNVGLSGNPKGMADTCQKKNKINLKGNNCHLSLVTENAEGNFMFHGDNFCGLNLRRPWRE